MSICLRQIRRTLGITQERMAQELSISLRTYTRQEKSGGTATLLKLASFIRQDTLASAPKHTP